MQLPIIFLDMNDVKIFESEEFGSIRTILLNGEPVFAATDVAKALQYANPAKAVIDHCKGVTVLETPTNGGVQGMKYIKEKDLYRLIMHSRAPKAEAFQDWVCDEILPSVRKHGAYMTDNFIEKTLTDPDYLIQVATTLKNERQARLLAEEEARKQTAIAEERRLTIKENAPKVVFANAVAGSSTSILIGELAKIIRQNGIKNMGEKRLFAWMRENHYLGTVGERYNVPNQQYIEQGLFELKTNTFSVNGEMKTKNTTKVTGKGQQYFINKFL